MRSDDIEVGNWVVVNRPLTSDAGPLNTGDVLLVETRPNRDGRFQASKDGVTYPVYNYQVDSY